MIAGDKMQSVGIHVLVHLSVPPPGAQNGTQCHGRAGIQRTVTASTVVPNSWHWSHTHPTKTRPFSRGSKGSVVQLGQQLFLILYDLWPGVSIGCEWPQALPFHAALETPSPPGTIEAMRLPQGRFLPGLHFVGCPGVSNFPPSAMQNAPKRVKLHDCMSGGRTCKERGI